MHFVQAKGILSAQNGMNAYRGCTHGCIYCDSRSACYGMDHDFEDVEVKENAVELLDRALARKRKKCMVGTGSMSDPYMPLEDELLVTRRCLEVIERRGFGATLITKSARVLRDLDLLGRINRKAKAVVQMTLTTADDDLCRKLEPGAPTTWERARALRALRDAGIPTVVWISPLLPYINDTKENLATLLELCLEADVRGVIYFGAGVTMREGNREYFYARLDERFPGTRARYEREFGESYMCASPRDRELGGLLHTVCERRGILHRPEDCFSYLKEFPAPYEQPTLFTVP